MTPFRGYTRQMPRLSRNPPDRISEAAGCRLLELFEKQSSPDRQPPEAGAAHDDMIGRTFEDLDGREHDHGPEVVAATILLGRGFASAPGLLERLRESAPAILVEVPHADWIDPMTRAAVACFEAADTQRRDPTATLLDETGYSEARHGAVVVAAVGNGSAWHGTNGDDKTTSAFRRHQALIGIASPTCRALPNDLLDASEMTLTIGCLDQEAVALIIEHVVGVRPSRAIAADIALQIGPSDLRIAIHKARGADGSADRLSALVERRQRTSAKPRGPRLDELVGYGEAAVWGLGVASDLVAYSRGELPWSSCEPGVLLAGAPGTGKTMFAGALAKQANVPLVAGSLAQWQSAGEGHLGTTLKAMRQFFEDAHRSAPCIALIDEVDSFGDRRRFAHEHRDYWTQLVNGLLECLDGDGRRRGVVVVGTTNQRDRIDGAILRSGRFDRCIDIQPPSVPEIEAILRHHLGRDLAEVDVGPAARRAFGGTGADCAAWVRRARGRSRRAGRAIVLEDLFVEIEASLPQVTVGWDRCTAIHECGHAVVAHALGMQPGDIALRHAGAAGNGFGSCLFSGESTWDVVADIIAVLLAGRAAEILILGKPSAGAASDLSVATKICADARFRCGLGKWLAVHEPSGVPDGHPVVENDLRRAAARAAGILADRRDRLDRLTEALLDRRALVGSEIAEILSV